MPTRVDYDSVADDFADRYRRNNYSGVIQAITEFSATPKSSHPMRGLEVGCGTGFWLETLHGTGCRVVGIDPSGGMLRVARANAPSALLARAQAEALPFESNTFDRLFCINALHHFSNPAEFVAEASRVLRPGGAILTVGLDPHTGTDRWWIYEYFPEAHAADLRRYLPAHAIRDRMEAAGFERCETRELQHLPRELPVVEAEREGFLARTSTSQLMVITDQEYEAGLGRIRRAAADAPEELVLRSDLRLYGTLAWRASGER